MILSRLVLSENSQEIKFTAVMEWDKHACAVIPCSHILHTGLQNSWTHSSDLKIIRSSHSVITGMVVPKGMLAQSLLNHVLEIQPPPFKGPGSSPSRTFLPNPLAEHKERSYSNQQWSSVFWKEINAETWHGSVHIILGYTVESRWLDIFQIFV